MNATKLYVIMKGICNIALTVGITVATCHLQCWPLLFFLIIPGCGMSMEVKSEAPKSTKNEEGK